LKSLFYTFILWLLISINCQASAPILLNDSTNSAVFEGIYLDYLEDPSNNLTLNDITFHFERKFRPGAPHEVISNKNFSSSYWTRLTVVNNSVIRKNWVIELYDYKIDYYEAYIPNDSGGYDKFTGGAQYNFGRKYYSHKNFIHDLYNLPHRPQTIYFKIKANRKVVFIGVIRTLQRMLEYSNMEYFLLSLFYGIVIAMIVYNSFLFISTLDAAYFFYVLYVTSIGLLALTKDGLGFQFVWQNHPTWNDSVPIISSFSMVFWALMYAKAFLNTKALHPMLDKGIILILIVRSILFIATFYFPSLAFNSWLDITPLLYTYALGIISWSLGYRMARFYILAFTLFFVGFTLSALNDFHVISAHPLIIYAFNIGVLCEMLLLSLALADRIKHLTVEKEEAQREIIIQSKENEILKDKINSELESKVHERTRELEEKNKELDTFVYRSSHDIKGPLKSIIGLTKIGLADVEDEVAKNYFDHILKSSKRLDSVVDHLLKVMETKESKIEITSINFETLIFDILSSLEHLPFYSKVKTEINITQEHPFYTDDKLLYSVLQNLLENALKYRDNHKPASFLHVNVFVSKEDTLLEIIDNGLGIEIKLQEKIFDMFYKVNPESSGSGLGLYMTKIYVEKLGGTLKLNSEVGEGSTFIIKLKNRETLIPA
jgi:signal transduction histidine kinase